jgi:hypothetical protein
MTSSQQLQEFAQQADTDWRDLARESKTHRIWQALPGNNFYQAVGVAEHVVADMLSGAYRHSGSARRRSADRAGYGRTTRRDGAA